MPIYEYKCNHCQHQVEKLQRLSDAPLVACPVCHEEALVKQVSLSSFQLKGTGWYVTDFKNKDTSSVQKAVPKETITETTAAE